MIFRYMLRQNALFSLRELHFDGGFSAVKVPKETSNKAFFRQETKETSFALIYIKSRSPNLRAKKTMKMKFSSFVFHLKMF